MKTVHLALLLTLLTGWVVSCKKADTPNIVSSCGSPPEPVRMVLLDKQGNNLVKSAADKVVISYTDNGQTQTIPCVIGSLQDGNTRQPTAKYGGIGIGCDLGGYSVRESNPIKTFQVMVNNQAAGTIYYDLQRNSPPKSVVIQDCYKVLSFQLNTVPVQTDDTVMPYVAVLNCNL